jgi:hypothetical protein
VRLESGHYRTAEKSLRNKHVVAAGRFVWDGRRRPPRAAYPRLPRPLARTGDRCGSHLAAYLALLRLGVAVPLLLPGARWALTPPFHPYHPVAREAVCFLWPCPSPCGAQELPGSLPDGARTFLGYLSTASATTVLDQHVEYSREALRWVSW